MSQAGTVPASRYVGLIPGGQGAQVTNQSTEHTLTLDNGDKLKPGESGYYDGPLSATAEFDLPVLVDESAEKPKAKATTKTSSKKSSSKSRSK